MKNNLDPIDIHIGARLRQSRTLCGLSQAKLGKLESISFQQVQKYESGCNRLSVSRLVRFAHILNVPVIWFLEDMPAEYVRGENQPKEDELCRRETLDLVRSYYRITNPDQRRAFGLILKSFAEKMG